MPHEALTAFNGEDANGDWTLRIDDSFPQDEGTARFLVAASSASDVPSS